MRKVDIKPGVVYAYQRWGRSGSREPIMFLTSSPWIGALWKETREPDVLAFRPARNAHAPQAGTVYNDGTIGYPAVLFEESKPTAEDLILLRSITFEDFRRARASWDAERGVNFVLVTSMARVVGLWEG
jgi:hypothetical protein